MLLDRIQYDNDIISISMQGLALRNEIIQNNIANSELPNFKKSDVLFEQSLQNEIDKYKENGEMNLENVKPKVKVINKELSYRLDGNNVDMEAEMVSLYKNDSKYSSMASSVMNNYKRINLVLNAK